MKHDIRLSTRVLTTQNAHQVGVLVTLTGESPLRRPPINVALVLDRSGSMDGAPLAAAKEAARRFVSFLGPADRLSLVTFDDDVSVVYGPLPGGSPTALEAIERIQSGGCTNLSGGWLMGQRLVGSGLVDGTNRVVLLTDGLANRGIADPARLEGMAGGAAEQRISTTCIGFGPQFNEDLLAAMARAGRGNSWYVETTDQMAGIFEEEIEGLVALAAQNVEATIHPAHRRVSGMTLLQDYPVEHTAAGDWRVLLGDLYATSPLALAFRLHVEDVSQLGPVQLAGLRIRYDRVTEQGIEQATLTFPVAANLDGEDHLEPTVEHTFLRFEVARARAEAVAHADRGDADGAVRCLREMATRIAQAAPGDAALQEMREDLETEALRQEQEGWSASDRKYHLAMSVAESRVAEGYRRKIRRGR